MALRVVSEKASNAEVNVPALIDEAWIATRRLVLALRAAEREIAVEDLDDSARAAGVPRSALRALEAEERLLSRLRGRGNGEAA